VARVVVETPTVNIPKMVVPSVLLEDIIARRAGAEARVFLLRIVSDKEIVQHVLGTHFVLQPVVEDVYLTMSVPEKILIADYAKMENVLRRMYVELDVKIIQGVQEVATDV